MFYSKDQLGEKKVEKILSKLIKTKQLSDKSKVEAIIIENSPLMSNALVATDSELIYFKGGGMILSADNYPYSGISSLNLTGTLVKKITLGQSGIGDITFEIVATPDEVKKMYDIIVSHKSGGQKQQSESVSDQIKSLHDLKEQGILTEDEFNAKKKQLLGL